jgi:hypothetical protein
MNQRELADFLAPQVSPIHFAWDRWSVSSDYIRAVWGEDATDRYLQAFDYEMYLKREGRFGEFVLGELGLNPPYEVSVKRTFPYVELPSIEELP